jgi:chromosome segregation ATPase
MKLQNTIHLTLAGLILFGSHLSTQAREETGDVLADLVESVDVKLSNLESSMKTQEKAQADVKTDLQKLKTNWESAETEKERLTMKSEIVKGLSELNSNDRLLVSQSMETILSVDEDLQRLQKVFREGVMGPERLKKQRAQIRGVLMGVGPLVASLSASLDDPQAKAQAATTEQTLVLLYKQLEATSDINADGMLAQITATTEALEEVAAQLAIVHSLLEMERYQLEVASQLSITELLFARLAEVRFGDGDLINVPQAFQDGVAQRDKAFGDILRSSSLTNPTVSRTQTDTAILSRIRRGQVPN